MYFVWRHQNWLFLQQEAWSFEIKLCNVFLFPFSPLHLEQNLCTLPQACAICFTSSFSRPGTDTANIVCPCVSLCLETFISMKAVYTLKSLWLRLSPLSKCHSCIKVILLPLAYHLLTFSPLPLALALFLQFNTFPYLLAFVWGETITVRINFVAWWQSCTHTMSHSCQKWCTEKSKLLLCLCFHSPRLRS